jgi:hypothetical protein
LWSKNNKFTKSIEQNKRMLRRCNRNLPVMLSINELAIGVVKKEIEREIAG